MTSRNLRLALQIQADLNQARQAVRNLGTDLTNTSTDASDATQQLEQTLDSAIREIQRLSGATDMQDGINELRQYEQQLESTAGATDGVSESNQFLENSVKSLAPHLMTLAGISGGFATIAVDTLNKAVELDRLAAFSTTGVEQFQYYAAGAKTAGVEVDSLAQIFKDARDKVGDFMSEGGGELKDFFENIAPKVGVTAEQFKKLTGPEIMQLYVNTLREAGVSENEMITHMERIADDATVLLPLFEKNGAGFKKYGDAAKNAGAILDKDFIEKAKIAKDALGQFQNQTTGVAYKLVAGAAPAIVFVAQNLDVLAKAGLIVASIWMGRVATSITATTIAFIQQRIAAVAASITLLRVNGVIATTTAAMRGLLTVSNLLTASSGFIGLAVAIAGVAASFMLMNDNSDTAIEGMEEQKKTVAELAEEYRKLNDVQQRIAVREATKKQDELTLAYKYQQSQLASLIEMGTRSNDVSEVQRNKAAQLVEQYKAGKITANQLATEYQKLNTVKASFRNRADDVATSISNAKSEMERQNLIVDVYTGKASSAAIATYDLNHSIDGTGDKAKTAATEIGHLSQAWKDYVKSAKENIFASTMEKSLLQKGFSEPLAKGLTDARVAKGQNLTANDTQLIMAQVSAEEAIEKIKEKQKKQEEAVTKQKEKQAKIAEQSLKINDRVKTQAQKYNYAGLEEQYKLPSGLLSAVSMQESKGNPFAKSSVGAYGAFQFMPATADRFKLKDRSNIATSAEAAAKYFQFLLKKFDGDLDKAIMGYNAGEGNVDNGKAYTFKETRDYLSKVKRYRANANGLNDENAQTELGQYDKAQSEALKKQEQENQFKLDVAARYNTEDENRLKEHNEKRKDILKAGFDQEKEMSLLLSEDFRFNKEKNAKSDALLKEMNEQVFGLENQFLKSSGRGLEADLAEVENKYKVLKTNIENLLAEGNLTAEQKQHWKSQLVRIDYVIDKEKLTLEFNNTMQQLEQLQSLRQQKQDTLKLKFDSGQISQPQYAEGLQTINSDMKPQLQGLAEDARDLAERLGDAFSVEKVNNFVAGLNEVDTNFKKFIPTAEQLNDQIAGGLTDSIMAWADGTKSAAEAFKSFASDFLRQIAQMILKQMMFNAISSAIGGAGAGAAAGSGGAGGMLSGLLTSAFGGKGYMSGGHTGFGARDEFAGIVHKDEWVITKPRTNEPGAKPFLAYFEKYGMQGLNKFKGYMDGGLVGAPNVSVPNITAKVADPAAMIANSTSFSANQNFYLVDDPARILDILKSGASQENLVVMMSRDPAKFKSALKIG